MDWAREAALALIDLRPADLHALQIGMVVCYARPFTTSYWLEPLGDEWLPGDPEGRQLHEQLVFLRDKWAAHTDEPSGRDVVKVEFGGAEVIAATCTRDSNPSWSSERRAYASRSGGGSSASGDGWSRSSTTGKPAASRARGRRAGLRLAVMEGRVRERGSHG